jgi:serine/threonine protein kinase
MNDDNSPSFIARGGYGLVSRLESGNVLKQMRLFYNEKLSNHIHSNIREIMFLSQFSHPNIITLYRVSCQSECGYIFLEMPFGGVNLEVWASNTSFSNRLKALTFIVAQIASVLKFISFHNILHGDLKPENILINPETLHVTVIDWGSCSFDVNKRTFCMCSEGYASPKSQKEELFDLSDDVFSLGMVISYLIYRTHESLAEKSALLTLRGNCFDVEHDILKSEINYDFYSLICMMSSKCPPSASYISDYLLDIYNPPQDRTCKISVPSNISSVFLPTLQLVEYYIRKILKDNYQPRTLNIAISYIIENNQEIMSTVDAELLGYAVAYIEDIIVENDEHKDREYFEEDVNMFEDIKTKALLVLTTVKNICI